MLSTQPHLHQTSCAADVSPPEPTDEMLVFATGAIIADKMIMDFAAYDASPPGVQEQLRRFLPQDTPQLRDLMLRWNADHDHHKDILKELMPAMSEYLKKRIYGTNR